MAIFTALSNTVQYNCRERVAAPILDISGLNLSSAEPLIRLNLAQSTPQS